MVKHTTDAESYHVAVSFVCIHPHFTHTDDSQRPASWPPGGIGGSVSRSRTLWHADRRSLRGRNHRPCDYWNGCWCGSDALCCRMCHTSGKHSWSVGVAEKLSYSWSATDIESLLSFSFFFSFNITLRQQGTAFDNFKFICWPDTGQSGAIQLVQFNAKTQDPKIDFKRHDLHPWRTVKLVRRNNSFQNSEFMGWFMI